jgi:hypothetical protein
MWLKEFSRLFVRPSTGRRTRPQAQRPRGARLALEPLEDRLAPASAELAPHDPPHAQPRAHKALVPLSIR